MAKLIPGYRILLLFTFLCILLLTTCKKDEKDENEIIIPETTKVISESQWEEGIILIDSNNWDLQVNPQMLEETGIEQGDIIVSEEGYGLIRRVDGITDSAGIAIINTSPAAICEAIQSGKINFTRDLSSQIKQARIDYVNPGVMIDTLSRDNKGTQLTLSLDIPLAEHVTMTGELSLDPTISGEVIIEDYELVYFNMEFTIAESFTLNTTVDIASLELEKEVEMVSITFPTFTVMVGVVPVVVTPQFKLFLGASLEMSSELSVGITQELTATAGITYENGTWGPYYELEKDLGHDGPSLNNTAEAKAYIKPQMNMMFYGSISPYLATELYGLVEADLSENPWWELFAGLKSEIGVKISIWILTLADINETLFDLKILLADATVAGDTPPEAKFTVYPGSGTTYTNFLFDASGSSDLKDPAEDLQVRWDWTNDGTWDTDYSLLKQEMHKYDENGSFTIALEVMDTDGLTDIARKSVSVNTGVNHPPEAAFTIDPPAGQDTTIFHFDASYCEDTEDPLPLLQVQWDWDGDGSWDTPLSTEKTATKQFQPGTHKPRLRVVDTEGLEDTCSVELFVYEGNPTNSFTDPRDGKVYGSVLIGSQWWMSENLNYGTMINSETDQADNGIPEKYCIENDETQCDIYGGHYQWDELMNHTTTPGTQGICPPGWHVPTQDEFELMVETLGGKEVAGGKMKHPGSLYWCDPNTGATNESGFTALPAGHRLLDGRIVQVCATAYFFTSSEWDEDEASDNFIYNNDDKILLNNIGDKKWGLSLRCVKD